MDNIKKRLVPQLEEQEGFRETAYLDGRGVPTIGTGFNLKDEEVRNILNLYGKDPAKLEAGEDTLDRDTNSLVKDRILDRKLNLTRQKLSPELWDTLNEDQQVTVGNLGYQSLNNIGPNLTNAIQNNDKYGAVYEIAANTNKYQDPGIQYRRLKQAQTYAGDDFFTILSSFDNETKKKILENLSNIENEHTRKEAMDAYEQYLKEKLFKRILTSTDK